jgi:hypothetical protein
VKFNFSNVDGTVYSGEMCFWGRIEPIPMGPGESSDDANCIEL